MTKLRVYKLLIEGYAQAQIARVLSISRQSVSRHTLALVKESYIRKVRGTKSPALYVKTSKPFPEDVTPPHRGLVKTPIRTHHTSRIATETHAPKRSWPFFWDRTDIRDGVEWNYVRNIVINTSEGPILVRTIRYIRGPNKSSLTVWLDADTIETVEQLRSHDEYSDERATLVIREIQRVTGARFSPHRPMQKTHYAVDAPPEIVDTALSMGLRGRNSWFDRSQGGNDAETDKEDIAEVWFDLPRIRDDLNRLNSAMVNVIEHSDDINTALHTLDQRLKSIEERLSSTHESPEDNYGGMYI